MCLQEIPKIHIIGFLLHLNKYYLKKYYLQRRRVEFLMFWRIPSSSCILQCNLNAAAEIGDLIM